MSIRYEEADKIFRAEKSLAPPLSWRPVENRASREQLRKMECRTIIGGGIPRGVWFRATVFPRFLESATFQLECDLPNKRTHVPLYRLELAPFAAHTNKLYGPDDISGLYIEPGQTHEHLFYDSVRPDGAELRVNACEQARIVANPPADFDSALRFVCERLNVTNGRDVPKPGDQGWLV